ncbi:IclR family transcriptional regulator [Mycobacterium sp. CVI_P3]|uniref:IclR family transcriptional regulator n=1 Tax=Mycobacterium pinniadriaticum TaxID=2994102 RepID=A0ABT3S9H4_9MYCO|nr:IclR family transcriptional regulator [Mycobacterium pinniadriaticum]MCX2929349.1 IclR family transcriptional regulator [Mycobacterium pinniadriaticum]MCX2935773.1 IclR family transcriptional regulator [Mycobacterium pinniadriaticum]
MAVKGSSTGARVLTVFEAVAAHQPVGVAALSRMLGMDKSAVQRSLVTLSEQGWIQPREDQMTRWEPTARVQHIAHSARAKSDLRQSIQQVLEQLAVQTGETAIFNEPDGPRLVVSQVAESQQPLRMVPRIGTPVPARESATGRILLPFLSDERQAELLGGPPDAALAALLDACRAQGYAASGDVNAPSMTIAAPVFEVDGRPIGVVAISGPAERMQPDSHSRLAALVCRAANSLSRGAPSSVSTRDVTS